MAPLATASRVLARSAPRCLCRAPVTATAGFSTSVARRDSGASASFESPFKGESKANDVPDFGHYVSKKPGNSNLLFQYFMVGTMGAITAAGAKSTIQGEQQCWREEGRGSLLRMGWGNEDLAF